MSVGGVARKIARKLLRAMIVVIGAEFIAAAMVLMLLGIDPRAVLAVGLVGSLLILIVV